MAKTLYDIQLKGYVGDVDFDRAEVDAMLQACRDKQVNVLIDSLGGSTAAGVSISQSFKQHGDVHVHFVGMNASAATIASLGAKHITIDAGALYLVHKCSVEFCAWDSFNADEFEALIAQAQKTKAELDKVDLNIASQYAARCRRTPEELLALMKKGGWLTAREALEWGFVDEVTDEPDEAAPLLTDSIATDMAGCGIPIPDIPLQKSTKGGAFSKFLSAIASLLTGQSTDHKSQIEKSEIMEKVYTHLCALLGVECLVLTDGYASLSDEQLTAVDKYIGELKDELADKDTEIDDLKNRLAADPADSTSSIVESGTVSEDPSMKSDAQRYVDTYNSARALFSQV